VLVDHGHTPDSAQHELRHTAASTPCSIQKAAEAVTDNPTSTLWNQHRSSAAGSSPMTQARVLGHRGSLSISCLDLGAVLHADA